ncbi:hypothetical protein LTS17_001929 [Exophiala oligosperma]
MSSYKATNPLPEPQTPDAIVSITPFESARMRMPNSMAILGDRGSTGINSWRFFMQHKPTDTKFWFDLGIAHDLTLYPPRIIDVQHKVFQTQPGTSTAAEDTQSLNHDPSEVKYIIASHAHWDHIFPADSLFPNATVLCGAGTLSWATPSYPSDPDSTFDGRIWDTTTAATDGRQGHARLPVRELSSPATSPEEWKPLGPFDHALDFFGDGSFHLIDAPGHCAGNLAALARTRNAAGELRYCFLGGDCFHSPLFMQYPDAPFGKGVKVTPTDTFHEDEAGARKVIRQTAELKREEGTRALIWIAHCETLEGLFEFTPHLRLE